MTATTKRVLIIDDEAIHLEALEAILDDAGLEVTSCNRAADALSLLRAGEKFDLILSDVMMPGMDGITLSREVKRLSPGVPVVLVTGRDSALDTVLDQGTLAIVKPYSAGTLRTLISQHIDLPD